MFIIGNKAEQIWKMIEKTKNRAKREREREKLSRYWRVYLQMNSTNR